MSRLNRLRKQRGRVVMSTIVIASIAIAGSCEAPSAPSAAPRVVQLVAATTSTTTVAPPEIGDAVVVERGGEQQVRRG